MPLNPSPPFLSRHGIPDELISDNGPQYSSQEFKDFAKPNWSYLDTFKHQNTQFKAEQEPQYNQHHCTRTLPTLEDKVQVWMKTRLEPIML